MMEDTKFDAMMAVPNPKGTVWQSVKSAAHSGLLIGVKWAIVIVVVGLTFMVLSGDYLMTRQRSIAGQNALDFINAQIAAAQKQQAAQPAAPPAAAVKPPDPTKK